MALLRTKEIRNMSPQERAEKLEALRSDRMPERGVAAMGGAPASPGKLRAIRTNIARILTIEAETKKTKEAKK